MKVTVEPSKATGIINAPPSKSMAHRLLIGAGLCQGESIIRGIDQSEDISATIDCLKALGVQVTVTDSVAVVHGIDVKNANAFTVLNCRESGSTLRFLLPIALLCEKNTVFSGSKHLFSRPLSVYEDICRERGLLYSRDEVSLIVKGPLTPGEYKLPGNISSQFVSGLLFALPLLNGASTVCVLPPVESSSYIHLTVNALSAFGIEVLHGQQNTLCIAGGQHYTKTRVSVEGDYSNAAFLDALNLFGGSVTVQGLSPTSLQGDKIYRRHFESLCRGTPVIHLADCPDLAPLLFAVAAAKFGGVFTGTKRLKLKESDRAQAMATELEKFGTAVTVHEDSVVIYPKEFHAPGQELFSHHDHRIAMALTVLLSVTGGTLTEAQAVNKSYPGFYEALKALQIDVNIREAD